MEDYHEPTVLLFSLQTLLILSYSNDFRWQSTRLDKAES